MADMDTAEKRLSTLDWDCPFMFGLHIPSGSSTAGERQHGMFTYSGVESGAPVIPPDSGDTKSSGRSATHRRNTIRFTTTRSGTTR